ncbi:DMT family transporter [Natrononativus amylolyticus]|uniref:DMT family transporter n=1 Tax=Natrononativus amylolyticus TaxID=2963434 RepID=UPI0020CE7400|nr:EamA family transporter [Natrononativus amylolyticus]
MSRLLEVSLFLFLAVLWGLSFPAIAVGLEYLPPVLFAAFRYDVAAVLLLAFAAWRVGGWLPRGRNNLLAIAGGGLFLVAGNGLLFIGQQTVPSGVAAIITALVPIFTALWAFVLLGERLSPVGAAGVGIGFLGIGFVIQPDPANLLAGDTVARLLIVGQVISVALGGVVVQRAAPTMGRVSLTGWSMLVGAVVLHVVSLGLGEGAGDGVTAPTAIGAVIYLGVFSTAVAFFIYFTILEEHGAFETALVAYLVPVVATVAGVFVLGETISPLAFVGFGLVATGFAVLKRRAIAEMVGFASGPASGETPRR